MGIDIDTSSFSPYSQADVEEIRKIATESHFPEQKLNSLNESSAEKSTDMPEEDELHSADNTNNISNLVDPQHQLTSPRQGINVQSGYARLFFGMVITIPVVAGFLMMTTGYEKMFSAKAPETKEEETEETTIQTETSEADRMKAQLAFSEQDSDLVEKPQVESQPVVKNPSTPTPQPVPQPQTTQTVDRTRVSRPQSPEPKKDPLEEWARLAALGTVSGQNQVENDTTVTSAPSSITTEPSEVDASAQLKTVQQQNSIEKKISEPTPSEKLNRTIQRGEVARVASISIGSSLNQVEDEQTQLNLDQEMDNFLLGVPQEESYLDRKAKEYREQDLLAQLASNGVVSSFESTESSIEKQEPNLSKKESYLDRKAREYREQDLLANLASNGVVSSFESTESRIEEQQPTLSKEESRSSASISSSPDSLRANHNRQVSGGKIPFGTSSKGEITSSIVWSEGIDSNLSRGSINIAEPILAHDGTVAIEAGSSLIVEVEAIANSGLVDFEVIAISYVDGSGALRQETIPTGAISIRGENNQPLIARRTNESGGLNLGQDILLSTLAAGERGFQVLNEPEEEFDFDFEDSDDNFSRRRISRRSNSRSSLLNGAAEGAFGIAKERLENRSEQIDQDRSAETPIYQVKAGTSVSIFINSFLEVNL